jgi:hypothetical protein
MKSIITFVLVFFSVTAFSQKIALIKTDFKSPIVYTDSLTINQLSQNYIPLETKCFDSINSILTYLITFLEEDKRAKMKSFELKSGNTIFKVSTISHAYGDSYDIDILTKIDEISSKFKLADNKNLNKKNSTKLKKFRDYLKSEKSLFNENYIEKSVRFYNIEVYE